MGDAADVPELQDDAAAGGVHGLGHLLPAFDLLGADRCPACRRSPGPGGVIWVASVMIRPAEARWA